MGNTERPSQPLFSKSSNVTSRLTSAGPEASYRARRVERLGANHKTKPCNKRLVEKSASSGGVKATVSRALVAVDTLLVELKLTEVDERFLADLIKRFVASGREGLRAPEDNMHPVHYAATHGLIKSAQFLLSVCNKRYLFSLRDKEQNNLVHLAAKNGHAGLLHWLIGQYGPMALMAKGCTGFCVLHYAAREGHLECVRLLLTFNQRRLLDSDDKGNAPVHWAARAGNLDVIRCMVEQYGPSVLLMSGANGRNPLQFAIQMNHLDCVSYIVKTCPASIKLPDNTGQNAIHQAAKTGNTEIFNYLITRADTEDIHAQDESNGNTALHLAANRGHEEIVEVLLNVSDRILDIKNNDLSNAAHLAALSGHLSVLKQIIRRKSYTMFELGCEDSTPLHFALHNGRIECVNWLLSNASIQKNLTRLDLFSMLISPDAQCQSLLAKARKAVAEPHRSEAPRHLETINPVGFAREWPPTRPTKNKPAGHADDWPAFSAQHRQWPSRFADQAKAVLTGFRAVGIYLTNNVYTKYTETRDKFVSIGDLNAGVQMAKILGDMGLKSLEVVVAPPDNSSCQQRLAYTHEQRHDYASLQEIARYKLALIWPDIDPQKPLPQVLKSGSCRITLRDCDDPEPLPQVMFSFRDVGDQLRNAGRLPEIGITLKPYRFASLYQQIIADTHDGRGNVLPLNLPPNSVISEVQRSQPDGGLSGLSSDRSLLGRLVHRLGRRSRAAKIDLSVVYGLHHRFISNPDVILARWVNSIQKLANAAPVKKPTIIAVASNIRLEDSLPAFARNMALPLIDLKAVALASAADREEFAGTVQVQIDNLPPGTPALCILPGLPKHQFDDLVLSSRLPVLTEGANMTSFLLEHGRPHLSLLPTGQTPVAQDMGDPLEAIKAEAFSSKLSMDEDSLKYLASLKRLLERQGSRAYQEALRRIDVIDKKEALAFVWRAKSKDTFLGLQQLSIRALLEQGRINGTLGEAGRKALMSALDPSVQGFMQYIREAMDEASPTATHFKLQQMHLGGASVNSINSALVKLGRYKGWIQ